MKLPLDHFRVLGVKPGVSGPEIEQALLERLRNPPSAGYSLETLDMRAELLRSSGAFLMDEQRRQSHGRQLATPPDEGESGEGQFSGIALEPGQEMVAPLLLLEAQKNLRAFELTLELLSRQGETAAFHGHQQADLLLMAALAARRTSQQMWTRRLYDQSAQILERVIQVLAPHASQSRRKAILEDDLYKVTPFQVLDLLDRESCNLEERQRGLRRLKALIDHRGGLDAEDDERCSPILFQDFFKQIRPCLTIDEQLELFEDYSSQGASTAAFLLAYTRAAAGFQRRQPAHVDAALTAIEALEVEGLEPEKACLLLLLGQPDAAQDMVKSCEDPHLCQWLVSSTSDSLPGLCSFCSEWLEQHVLPCYLDVDPQGKVDLDAYFLDAQVQDYIKARHPLPPARDGQQEGGSDGANGTDRAKQTRDPTLFTPLHPVRKGPHGGQAGQQAPEPLSSSPLPLPPPHHPGRDAPRPHTARPAAKSNRGRNAAPTRPSRPSLLPLMAKGALAAGVTVALVLLRPWSLLSTGGMPASNTFWILTALGLRAPNPAPPQPSPSPPAEVGIPNPPPVAPIPFDRPRIQAVQETGALDRAGVTTLLRAWLHVKASVLGAGPATQPGPDMLDALALLAVPEQVTAVLDQHQRLRERGQQLDVSATLEDVSLLAQTPDQVSVRVVLTYAETARSADGDANTLGPTKLRNDYTFTRGQKGWKLLRFAPSPSPGAASRQGAS